MRYLHESGTGIEPQHANGVRDVRGARERGCIHRGGTSSAIRGLGSFGQDELDHFQQELVARLQHESRLGTQSLVVHCLADEIDGRDEGLAAQLIAIVGELFERVDHVHIDARGQNEGIGVCGYVTEGEDDGVDVRTVLDFAAALEQAEQTAATTALAGIGLDKHLNLLQHRIEVRVRSVAECLRATLSLECLIVIHFAEQRVETAANELLVMHELQHYTQVFEGHALQERCLFVHAQLFAECVAEAHGPLIVVDQLDRLGQEAQQVLLPLALTPLRGCDGRVSTRRDDEGGGVLGHANTYSRRA